MIPAIISALSEDDLKRLGELEIPESLTIEYKESLPGGKDDDVREFLADVTSLANSSGGDLLFGIAQTKNAEGNTVAGPISPISGIDADGVKLRLENLLRDCVMPRLAGVIIREVPVTGGTVFVVRVPRSWNGPHVVSHKSHWRFYARNSAGKYPMDIHELRDGFVLTSTIAAQIETFRAARLQVIGSDAHLGPEARIVVHIVPFEAMRPGTQIDVDIVRALPNLFYPLIYSDPSDYINYAIRYTFEGLEVNDYKDGRTDGYVAIFRNGSIEVVDTQMLDWDYRYSDKPADKVRLCPAFEAQTFLAIARYAHGLETAGFSGPAALMISLLGVRGRYLAERRRAPIEMTDIRGHAIEHEDLVLPTTLITLPATDLAERIQPLFDMIWNAAGLPRSVTRLADLSGSS